MPGFFATLRSGDAATRRRVLIFKPEIEILNELGVLY